MNKMICANREDPEASLFGLCGTSSGSSLFAKVPVLGFLVNLTNKASLNLKKSLFGLLTHFLSAQ